MRYVKKGWNSITNSDPPITNHNPLKTSYTGLYLELKMVQKFRRFKGSILFLLTF